MIDFIFQNYLSDFLLTNFWDSVRRSGRDTMFFYDREKLNEGGFIQWCRLKDNFVWLVRYNKKVVGMCVLNSHRGDTAYGHFLLLPQKTLRIGKRPFQTAICSEMLKYWLSIKNVEGKPVLQRVLGLTPVSNKGAIHAIHSWGAKDIAVIPGACYFFSTAENVDGLLTETKLEYLN